MSQNIHIYSTQLKYILSKNLLSWKNPWVVTPVPRLGELVILWNNFTNIITIYHLPPQFHPLGDQELAQTLVFWWLLSGSEQYISQQMNWYTLARRQVASVFKLYWDKFERAPHLGDFIVHVCVCVYVCLYRSLNINEHIQIFHKDWMPTCTCKDYCRLQTAGSEDALA